MRILFITQWFHPEPSFKTLSFAQELTRLGHEVEVLTGFPNYPGGKIYDGYRVKLFQRENIDGVVVIRVPLYPSHDRSGIRRFLNYTSFAFSATAIGPWLTSRPDVVYVYHPPATIYLPASFIGLLRRIPIVLDIQDLWPESLKVSGMFENRFGLRLVDQYCRFFYRHVEKIVVLSPGFKRVLCKRGISADKIEIIYNWCDDAAIRPIAPDQKLLYELGQKDRFNVIFAGNMGKGQALDAILYAAQVVAGRCPRVQFVFIGDGIEKDNLRQMAAETGLENVRFLPRRPASEIASVLSLADVLLVHLKDDPLYRITIPSKIQAYLAVARPILVGVRGDAAALVTKAQGGIACTPQDPRDIAEKICSLEAMPADQLRAMGENGRRFYQQELSLSIAAKRFEAIFKSVKRS